LVLRGFLHGRRLVDCRLARRADFLRDLTASVKGLRQPNLRQAAKAFGLTILPTLLAYADR
jgi:hypothetical protein